MQKSHIRNTLLGLLIIVGLNSVTAQIRKLDTSDDKLQSIEALDLYGYKPTVKPTVKEAPVGDFNFNYDFGNLNMLFDLNNSMAAYNKAKVDEWVKKQELFFKDEINRQLRTSYTKFEDAQKELFKRFEVQNATLLARSNSVKSSQLPKYKLNYENRINYAETIYQIDQMISCRNGSRIGESCTQVGEIVLSVGNKKIKDITTPALASYREHYVSGFSNYFIAEKTYSSWANGLSKITTNGTLYNEITQKHRTNYLNQDWYGKVSLMSAYLLEYKNPSPLVIINSPRQKIPVVSDNNSILELGKKYAEAMPIEALVLQDNYINDQVKKCLKSLWRQRSGECTFLKTNLEKIKSDLLKNELGAIAGSGPNLGIKLYGSLWIRKPNASWLQNPANIKEIKTYTDYLKSHNSAEDRAFVEEAINFSQNELLTSGTTREQLISEITIYTDVIGKYGNSSEKELASYLKEINKKFSDFSNTELYSYYLTTRDLRLKMQLRRLLTIVSSVVDSFEPVMNLALVNLGANLTYKFLYSLPKILKSPEVTAIINRLFLRSPQSSMKFFQYAEKFGFNTYAEHVKVFNALKLSRSGMGVEIHHLIEQRFLANPDVARWLGSNTNNWQSIVLTKAEHRIFTARWNAAIGYDTKVIGYTGYRTSTATLNSVKQTAKEIYKDYPEILKALGL